MIWTKEREVTEILKGACSSSTGVMVHLGTFLFTAFDSGSKVLTICTSLKNRHAVLFMMKLNTKTTVHRRNPFIAQIKKSILMSATEAQPVPKVLITEAMLQPRIYSTDFHFAKTADSLESGAPSWSFWLKIFELDFQEYTELLNSASEQ